MPDSEKLLATTAHTHMTNLQQVLAQEDTVLFIGSGVSLWAGLPTWPGMIEELAKFIEHHGANAEPIRAEAKRGDLLQAASYGFDQLTKSQIGAFIKAACRYGVAVPHEIHRKIVTLGPRCFITTNYDNLIEQSLKKWMSDRFYGQPVTNRHLTETAEIVHARAIDFVFKPHGDASDCDSIILTREQYRQLLPQGERHAALESLKTLLVSRPVVYIGFGLKDPDFIYLRDLLANTYKGGTRDHYALMSDVSTHEADYWKRNYGIHLTSYPTTTLADGKRDHSELLRILDQLQPPNTLGMAAPAFNPKAPEVLLAFARYGAALGRATSVSPELPIRVTAESPVTRGLWSQLDRFDHSPVEKFLDSGPTRAILIGLPGAGKTYALRRSAARLADKLHEITLSDSFDESKVIVPIIVDLKLYQGDLTLLVSQTLPKAVPLSEVLQHFEVKIFLDSFNEMPREFWENGSYEADFAKFTQSIGNASLIFGSRTTDGLAKLGLPVYSLDQIDKIVLTTELEKMGLKIGGRFEVEIHHLLQKPFYFQFIANGAFTLPREAHPKDLYQSLFGNLQKAFRVRFGKDFNLEDALSLAAYEAIDRGQEAFSLTDILRAIKINLEAASILDVDSREIANWLVSQSILLPYSGGRVSFVHQSVTEFLAAKELAKRYQASPKMLRKKLTLTRWDQALFLALSFLQRTEAESFFKAIVEADFALALNAVKYLEVGREKFVSKLLKEVPSRLTKYDPFESGIEWIIQTSLPVSATHEKELRALMNLGDSIAAVAVSKLVSVKGVAVKNELLNLMFTFRSDYNYCCNGIATALKPFATRDDIQKIRDLALTLIQIEDPNADEDKIHGFTLGAAIFLSELELSDIREAFFPTKDDGPVPKIFAHILCRILQDHDSTLALDFAGELLLREVNDAAITIYFIAKYRKSKEKLSWSSFNLGHIDRLISIMDDPNDDSWGIKALQCLCAEREDLASAVRSRALLKLGIEKAAFLYSANPADSAPVFEALGDFVKLSSEQRSVQPTHLLKHIDLNWAGQEKLFVELLKLRDTQLALVVLESPIIGSKVSMGHLEIGPIDWWLDWLTDSPDFFLHDRISRLFASSLPEKTIDLFVAEFNRLNSKYRAVLANSVLLMRNDLSTDDFSGDAISYLLADLYQPNERRAWRGSLLGLTATDHFVTERLLTMTAEANNPFADNLQHVLRQAGKRHGRRYIDE
jgi:hypothetical protein